MQSLHGMLQNPSASHWHAVQILSALPSGSTSALFGCLLCVFMAPFIALAACIYQKVLHDTVQLPALMAIVHAGHQPAVFNGLQL